MWKVCDSRDDETGGLLSKRSRRPVESCRPPTSPKTTSWQPSASTAVVGASATFTSPSFPRELDVAGRRALFTARSVRNYTVVSVRASRFLHGPIWHLARLETGSHPVVARESRPANAKPKKKQKTENEKERKVPAGAPSISSRCRRGAPWSAERPNESVCCVLCAPAPAAAAAERFQRTAKLSG